MAKGKPTEYYAIDFSVDIKRNITIWRGVVIKPSEKIYPIDWFSYYPGEVGIHSSFLPEGEKLLEMEREVANSLTRDELINAFLDFRKAHPRDGWGYDLFFIREEDLINECKGYEEGMRVDRDDKKQVYEALQRRNREYIKELWGVDLSGYPLDIDFAKEWERRQDEFRRKNGFDKKPTDEEIWGRKLP